MGCVQSNAGGWSSQIPASNICWRSTEDVTCTAVTTANVNEGEIDLSHFCRNPMVVLGMGGFGIVWLVRKISGSDKGVEYAMKSMSKEAILKRSSGAIAVDTELRALITLNNCENICQLHYAFQTSSHLFMVLELAAQGDLRHNLRAMTQAKLPEHVAKLLFIQLVNALQHCHMSSILHRDLKPENLLLTDAGVLKLSDFGVAKFLSNLQDCRSTSGTHGYMAPEIYIGNHSHGTASEWFSAGVTLHELLTGRRPFEASRLQSFRSFRVPPAEWLPHSSPSPSPLSAAAAAASTSSSVPAAADAFLLKQKQQSSSDNPTGPRKKKSHSKKQQQQGSSCPAADALYPDYLLHQPDCAQLSQECKDFVCQLLTGNALDRLGSPYRHCKGNISHAVDAVKAHPWLQQISETDIYKETSITINASQSSSSPRKVVDIRRGIIRISAPIDSIQAADPPLPQSALHINNAVGCCDESVFSPSSNASLSRSSRHELYQTLRLHLQSKDIIGEEQHSLFHNYKFRNGIAQENQLNTADPADPVEPPPCPRSPAEEADSVTMATAAARKVSLVSAAVEIQSPRAARSSIREDSDSHPDMG